MLNFLSVMYYLSEKVQLDKVVPEYLFHPQARVQIAQESRLRLQPDELKEYLSTLSKYYYDKI